MKIYISGISGTAMGALALFANDSNIEVYGSDQKEGAVTSELRERKINFEIGAQDGTFLSKCYEKNKIDWFIYTSALPQDHPELLLAQKLGIKISKRDELISFLINEFNLRLVAIAGTHGKTTTTAMIIFACLKLGIPISYLVGSTLPFGNAGKFDKNSKYIIYEADEYDKNFLNFYPWLSAITIIDYDHPDIYPTKESYQQAFEQFRTQSLNFIKYQKINEKINISGEVRKKDASLAFDCIKKIISEEKLQISDEKIFELLNSFPGAGRRFEKIADGIYSDYAHHPEEIKVTIEIAREEAVKLHKKGIVVIYEPHQNSRQHTIYQNYKGVFWGTEKIFWLPTFLVREDKSLPVLSQDFLISTLDNNSVAEKAFLDNELANKIFILQKEGYLIVLMTAGPADEWLRELFGNS